MIEVAQFEVETSEGTGIAHVPHMDGFKAGKLFTWLAKKLGPGLVALAESSKGNKAELGLATLTEGLEEADFEKLVNNLLGGCRIAVGGQFHDMPQAYGKLFAGKTFEGFKLLWKAFQHNYGNFSNALGALASQSTPPKA